VPVYLLTDELIFPPPEHAEPGGLLAVGGDLRTDRLRLAYRNGIFPWYSEGEPITWYSPDPRMILEPESFRATKSLRRALRAADVRITFDRAFDDVIRRCAEIPRNHEDGTWITPDMMQAYTTLHDEGDAHSVEVWVGDALVGGLYGLAVGAAFTGESMFSLRSGASKFALAFLAHHLAGWRFGLVDCQLPVAHLERLGAVAWTRTRYLRALRELASRAGRDGSWADVPSLTGRELLDVLELGRG